MQYDGSYNFPPITKRDYIAAYGFDGACIYEMKQDQLNPRRIQVNMDQLDSNTAKNRVNQRDEESK